MDCIDVIRSIIRELRLESAQFTLFEHSVGINWRVRYRSTADRVNHLEEGLRQHSPFNQWQRLGKDILKQDFNPRKLVSRGTHVISISSKTECRAQTARHLAMMNLHPEKGVGLKQLAGMVEAVTEGMPGYLLESGRHYHFYGFALLKEDEWIRFMAQFLMPTVLVSPRYIGHCLHRGYAALRLSTAERYKPMLPAVCCAIGGLAHTTVKEGQPAD